MSQALHKPVLLDEVINSLSIKPSGIYVDGTVGYAGHSIEIIKRLKKNGRLICIDQDAYALDKARDLLKKYENVTFVESNFTNIDLILKGLNIDEVDGILVDLGVSSVHLDNKERGFTYREDGPLDMRMNQKQILTAKEIVNSYSKDELSKIFKEYGEVKFYNSVATNIVKYRETKQIETTFDLVEIIKQSLPAKELRKKGHPAKQYFQALRIVVNNELQVLIDFLTKSVKYLGKNGRLAVISFHSLEDRIVKNFFNELANPKGNLPKGVPIMEHIKREFELVNKKIIIASEKETEINRRAASAKLRCIKKL